MSFSVTLLKVGTTFLRLITEVGRIDFTVTFLDFWVAVTFSVTSSELFSESSKEISTFSVASETGSIEAFKQADCLVSAAFFVNFLVAVCFFLFTRTAGKISVGCELFPCTDEDEGIDEPFLG